MVEIDTLRLFQFIQTRFPTRGMGSHAIGVVVEEDVKGGCSYL